MSKRPSPSPSTSKDSCPKRQYIALDQAVVQVQLSDDEEGNFDDIYDPGSDFSDVDSDSEDYQPVNVYLPRTTPSTSTAQQQQQPADRSADPPSDDHLPSSSGDTTSRSTTMSTPTIDLPAPPAPAARNLDYLSTGWNKTFTQKDLECDTNYSDDEGAGPILLPTLAGVKCLDPSSSPLDFLSLFLGE